MKYAIAMYRAGMIVNACDCDYESARTLGIICPFCSEAVFLRRGTLRERKGRQEVVEASFAHYRTDDPMHDDCELRSQRQEGQEYIKRLESESKKQRLELYNNYLWEMFRDDRNISRQMLARVRKGYGGSWVDGMALTVHREFRLRSDMCYQVAADHIDALINVKGEDLKQHPIAQVVQSFSKHGTEAMQTDIDHQVAYFSGIDRTLHLAITQEIIDFLGSRTSGYVFRKIFISWLNQACIAMGNYFQSEFSPATAKAILAAGPFGPEIVKRVKAVTPASFCEGVAMTVVGTHWIDQIQKRLGENKD